MKPHPPLSPITQEQTEQLLRSMPQFKRAPAAEKAFFEMMVELGSGRARPSLQIWPRFAFAGSFALMIALVGSVAWAYQPGVTRGHFLYPLKKTAEKIELSFAATSLDKVDTHLAFSDRRLAEAENIVSASPSLSWIFKPAQASTDEVVDIPTSQEVNLVDTLAEMRSEVLLASDIVEKDVSDLEEAKKALKKIETATDRHVEALGTLAKKVPVRAQSAVQEASDEQDDRLAAVVEAEENLEDKETPRGEKVKVSVKLKKREVQKTARRDAALAEFQEALNLYTSLPDNERSTFSKKMQRATNAMQGEKFGMAKEFSRSLKTRIQKTLTPDAPVNVKSSNNSKLEKKARDEQEEEKKQQLEEKRAR